MERFDLPHECLDGGPELARGFAVARRCDRLARVVRVDNLPNSTFVAFESDLIWSEVEFDPAHGDASVYLARSSTSPTTAATSGGSSGPTARSTCCSRSGTTTTGQKRGVGSGGVAFRARGRPEGGAHTASARPLSSAGRTGSNGVRDRTRRAVLARDRHRRRRGPSRFSETSASARSRGSAPDTVQPSGCAFQSTSRAATSSPKRAGSGRTSRQGHGRPLRRDVGGARLDEPSTVTDCIHGAGWGWPSRRRRATASRRIARKVRTCGRRSATRRWDRRRRAAARPDADDSDDVAPGCGSLSLLRGVDASDGVSVGLQMPNLISCLCVVATFAWGAPCFVAAANETCFSRACNDPILARHPARLAPRKTVYRQMRTGRVVTAGRC